MGFFRENKLDYEKICMPEVKGWKFKTKDGRLCIYACDFFSLTPAMVGEVDAVYDRGALEAINVCDRQGYVKLMHQIVGNEFRDVLNAYEYDDSVFQGPPRNLPRDEVFNLFGKILLYSRPVVILVVQSPNLSRFWKRL